MANDDEPIYCVQSEAGKFQVLDASEKVVMVCHDEGSARHYAVLLNEAYQKGFKAGYREGKKG
jgi:flagellar biosynthesis/type III secretory pathway protein FliH